MNTETQFTPGPWIWIPGLYPVVPGDSCDIKNEAGDWIATAHTQFKGVENGEANARLIAAAPDMYEFLKKVAIFHPDGNPITLIKEAQSLLNRIQ